MMCTRAKMKFVGKMKIIGIDRVRHPWRSAASIDIRQQQKPQRQRGCTEQICMLSGYLEIISG